MTSVLEVCELLVKRPDRFHRFQLLRWLTWRQIAATAAQPIIPPQLRKNPRSPMSSNVKTHDEYMAGYQSTEMVRDPGCSFFIPPTASALSFVGVNYK